MPCSDWTVTGPEQRCRRSFHPVRSRVRDLLKSVFPEYASSSRGSMWRAGIITKLRREAAVDRKSATAVAEVDAAEVEAATVAALTKALEHDDKIIRQLATSALKKIRAGGTGS